MCSLATGGGLGKRTPLRVPRYDRFVADPTAAPGSSEREDKVLNSTGYQMPVGNEWNIYDRDLPADPPELASALQTAILLGDRPLLFTLAALLLPVRLSDLTDDELNLSQRAVANDLRVMLGRVWNDLQDRRGLAHAERVRKLRNWAEALKREVGGKEPPPPGQGRNDVSWG